MTQERSQERARLADVKRDERRPFALSAGLFFCVMFSYYLIRGLRDELGIRQGLDNLDELWQWTAILALAVNPLVGWAVARFPRRIFVPLALRAGLVGLVVTYFALTTNAPTAGEAPNAAWLFAARAFYVTVSMWVMLATSLFWSLMADVWRSGQGKRLFGLIATGGSLAGLAGSGLSLVTALWSNPAYVLLMAAVVLEVGAQFGKRVVRIADASGPSSGERIGGSMLAGITEVARSPYLLLLAGYLLLITLANGFLYQQTSAVLYELVPESARRTAIFNGMDLATNLASLLAQGGLAAIIARRYGVGVLLGVMPLLCFGGFVTLVFLPIVPVIVAFNVVARTSRYAFMRPGRTLLFTAVSRSQRYKAQNFLDVGLYRVGDAGTAEVYETVVENPLPFLPEGVPASAAVVAPVCLLGAGLALTLGRSFERRAVPADA